MPNSQFTEFPGIVVRQWLKEWNSVTFDSEELRRKPEPQFYLFSIPARLLRKWSDVHRRQAVGKRAADKASQRQHLPKRSLEIGRFIHGGFPWSDLSDAQKRSHEFKDLRMPGWLSTAIIANVLSPGTERLGSKLRKEDAITVSVERDGTARLRIPRDIEEKGWDPKVKPLEIIDGQHRLLAFETNDNLTDDYELPVVVFNDLDITWQAYLFYTINIKPKRINASLAFDLYPVLRTQDWLEASPTGAFIYREIRAQELTEALWSYPQSPWHQRINMLGEPGAGTVTQASFIRSLTATFIKRWESGRIGGLFGASLDKNPSDVLFWNRTQQAAFLIMIWQKMAKATVSADTEWATELRKHRRRVPQESEGKKSDFAFTSQFSLLASDQGVRGIMQIFNDMFFLAYGELGLFDWLFWAEFEEEGIDDRAIAEAIASLKKSPASEFMEKIASILSEFEWRNSSTPEMDPELSRNQMIYRGSGGYKQLRIALLRLLSEAEDKQISKLAKAVTKKLGY